MVAVSVVPEIEAKDVVSLFEQRISRAYDVSGVGTAFPAVQQNNFAGRLCPCLNRMLTQEPDPIVCR